MMLIRQIVMGLMCLALLCVQGAAQTKPPAKDEGSIFDFGDDQSGKKKPAKRPAPPSDDDDTTTETNN